MQVVGRGRVSFPALRFYTDMGYGNAAKVGGRATTSENQARHDLVCLYCRRRLFLVFAHLSSFPFSTYSRSYPNSKYSNQKKFTHQSHPTHAFSTARLILPSWIILSLSIRLIIHKPTKSLSSSLSPHLERQTRLKNLKYSIASIHSNVAREETHCLGCSLAASEPTAFQRSES